MANELVAVVDDEASVRKALLRLLRSANYQAEAFESAHAFLASLEDHVPDCVVLDLQMPAMSGLELQERLSRLDSRPPVIVITAHDEPGTRERCIALGALRYLSKPIDGNHLIESIRSVIAGAASQQAATRDAAGSAASSNGHESPGQANAKAPSKDEDDATR